MKTPLEKLQEVAILAKSHVEGYTRGDGTYVQAHDDKRTKTSIDDHQINKWSHEEGKFVPAVDEHRHKFDHPHVVGYAKNHTLKSNKDGNGNLASKHSNRMHFSGKVYFATGKKAKSSHDGESLQHYESFEGHGPGHEVWGDAKGRVHAHDHSDGQNPTAYKKEIMQQRAAGSEHGNDVPTYKNEPSEKKD